MYTKYVLPLNLPAKLIIFATTLYQTIFQSSLLMNKILFLTVILTVFSGCSRRYKVQGSIDDCKSPYIYLITSSKVIDSVAVTDGSFSFTGRAWIPVLAYISDARKVGTSDLECMIVLEPGSLSVLKNDDTIGYTVKGSYSNDMLDEMAHNRVKMDKREWDDYIANNAMNQKDNMFGLVCASELANHLKPGLAGWIINSFKRPIRKTELWKQLYESNRADLAVSIGDQYKNFSQPDTAGVIVSALDVIENSGYKYVLIDFWASWCGPCMMEVPYLKRALTKYSDKGFQILGVSVDNNRDDWINAINKYQMDWIQLSELHGNLNSVSFDYGVYAIPSNFLIDCTTGRIIATSLRQNKLEKKLSELLN